MRPFGLGVLMTATGVLAGAGPVAAHQVSEAYLLVEIGETAASVQCEVALRDLEYVLGGRKPLTAATPAAATAPPDTRRMADYVAERLSFRTEGEPLAL